MTQLVAEGFLTALKAHGVDWVFSNSGTDFAPIIEGLVRAQEAGSDVPRMVPILHENVAVSMAHGYYLATGRPQAVMVHVNVGTANALLGVISAQRDHVPLLLAAGRSPVNEAGGPGSRSSVIHWGQEMFDQAGSIREFTKWDYELRAGESVTAVVDRALSIAMAEPRGPVYISLPRETLGESIESRPVSELAFTPQSSPPGPDPRVMKSIAAQVAGARRPLIITSRGSRDLFDVLPGFAERFGTPVVQMRCAQLSMPTGHAFDAGMNPNVFVGDADLIMVLDSPVPWLPNEATPKSDAVIIHVGPDPLAAEIPMRNFPATHVVASSPSLFIDALTNELDRIGAASAVAERRERLATELVEYRKANATTSIRDGVAPAREPGLMSSALITRCLSEAISDDAIVVNELGVDAELMSFTRWDSYMGPPFSGGLGWGVPAALGIKLADPSRPVIATVGDGSYIFANPPACHQAASSLGLGLLTVVFDNGKWNAVGRATRGMYPTGRAVAQDVIPLTAFGPRPDYRMLAEAFGAHGETVDDPDRLVDALVEALKVTASGRQALVAVRCR